MTEHVPEERVAFSLHADGPLVTLRDTTCSVDAEWRVLNRLMLVVIDGPGDEGFLLQRRPRNDTDLAPAGWDEAVDRFGGVLVDVPGGPRPLRGPHRGRVASRCGRAVLPEGCQDRTAAGRALAAPALSLAARPRLPHQRGRARRRRTRCPRGRS